jgi:ABC-type transporter MlaC component
MGAAAWTALAGRGWAASREGPASPVLALRGALLDLAERGWPPSRPAVGALVRRHFDLNRITTTVLGKEGAAATPEQRRRLSATLATRLESEILRAQRPRRDDGFAVTGVRPIGKGEWLVNTRALATDRRGSAPTPVVLAWRIRQGGAGPRIVDTLRDGQGAVVLQHEDFVNALRGHDIEWVIARMERRAATLTESS